MARWPGSSLLRLVSPGYREVHAQVAVYARWWAESNERALRGAGPLWVALGDSTAQGIGASSPEGGYVGQLRRRLGDEWRVVNLSRSGARTAEVLRTQVPRMPDGADLVTCAVGANDLVWRTRVDRLVATFRELVQALPAGAVIATLPQGLAPQRAHTVNELIAAEAPAHQLRVADVYAQTGPPWRGRFASDGFHPNDRGYAGWADAFADAIFQPRGSVENPLL